MSPRCRADGTLPRHFAGSESGVRHRVERVLELGGAVVSVLDRLDREDVRLLPLRRVIASAVGLRWVRRQHSPLVAMHHMILRVRRKFFEITTKPNSGIRA